jgi:hypothetical protein
MVIPILIGFLFIAIGTFILISAVVSMLKRRKQNARSQSTTGVVVGFAREMGRRGYLFYPQVEFQLATGQIIRFQSSVGSNRATYGIGEQVKVLFSAYNPQEAEIDSVSAMWLMPGCMMGIGIIFLVIGLFLSALMILVAMNQQ